MSTLELLGELRDVLLRSGAAVARDMRPGRSEDEVRAAVASITADPHPDLIAWFTFWEGPADEGQPIHSFAFEHEPLALNDVVARHRDQQVSFADEYAGYDPRLVPFTWKGAIDCSDRPQRGCAFSLDHHVSLMYVDSLADVLRFWIACHSEDVYSVDPETGARTTMDLALRRDLLEAFAATPSVVPPFPEQPGLSFSMAVRTFQGF